MATVTSAAVTLPTFTGLKATSSARSSTARVATTATPKFSIKASWKDLGVAVAATAATAVIASNALAFEVLMGSDAGELVFVPSKFEVASGEKITFVNNAGFPHNVVFEDGEVPAGVDPAKISMDEDDTLTAQGQTYSVTLTEKGTYSFYCSPHQGAPMKGTITVK